jgi:hypothetical protein
MADVAVSSTVADQVERAFQKQPTVFLGYKRVQALKGKAASTLRWTRSVGLGFKTPEAASKGELCLQCAAGRPPGAPVDRSGVQSASSAVRRLLAARPCAAAFRAALRAPQVHPTGAGYGQASGYTPA